MLFISVERGKKKLGNVHGIMYDGYDRRGNGMMVD